MKDELHTNLRSLLFKFTLKIYRNWWKKCIYYTCSRLLVILLHFVWRAFNWMAFVLRKIDRERRTLDRQRKHLVAYTLHCNMGTDDCGTSMWVVNIQMIFYSSFVFRHGFFLRCIFIFLFHIYSQLNTKTEKKSVDFSLFAAKNPKKLIKKCL